MSLRRDQRTVLPREPVATGEMRITVTGSGMPYTRRAQASASFLVQLGDNDQTTLLFDLGSGAMANVNAVGVDYSKLNTVFLTHYHVDHTGDLPALLGGGMVMGRLEPLTVFGPSGARPEHGLNHLCEGLRNLIRWDVDSRIGRVPSGRAEELLCHEFNYRKVNQTVFNSSGILVTASPVVHAIDGPVAYRLDWRGRSFVFSGDTKPTTNMVDLARGSDVFAHEGFVPPSTLAYAMSLPLESAEHIVEHVHTPLRAVGHIFRLAQPKLGVVYHLWRNDEDMTDIIDEVRTTYQGPLVIADDLMVFEIHNGGVRKRKMLLQDRPFPVPDRAKQDVFAAQVERRLGLSEELLKTVISVPPANLNFKLDTFKLDTFKFA
eukprot:TRINITY_DN64434_c0_g1_i1.p1 TRINITY_DN64434_c0_g1~~TRINITY_DN64434_c0_g1_i1.p1  ORF type:complete len:429 (+),score=58.42 TRINITY_DN64434_c0_g1_i1:160-1287(+)